HAHGAARALQQLLGVGGTLAQAGKLAEAELEDAGHTGRPAVRLDGTVQLRQVVARPEAALETIRLAARAVDAAALAEDDRPGGERGEQQQPDHELHRHARLHDQAQNRQLVTHGSTPARPAPPSEIAATA